MDRFVLGFAFNKSMDFILLVRKLRPDWQKGLLNGIGGKIEKGESSFDAMGRECKEETGLTLDWIRKAIMEGKNNDGHTFRCHIFYAFSQEIFNYKQIEDEVLRLYRPLELQDERVVQNLRFLIPFGMCSDGSTFMGLSY